MKQPDLVSKKLLFWALSTLALTVNPVSRAAPRSSINVAFEDSIRSFDPRQSVDANSQYLEDLIHCAPIGFDQDGGLLPIAATQLPVWKDPKTLELEIRSGLRFTDGSPVTAKDALATYISMLKGKGFARSAAFSNIQDIALANENTLQFSLKKPDASFVSNLVVGILPSALAEKDAIAPEAMIGCGPFRIKSMGVTEIVLDRNPHSPVQAKLKEVHIKTVKNEKTRFFKLQTGEIDIVQNAINRDTLKTAEKRSPNLKLLRRPALKTTYLGFNMKDTLTSNPVIREAISLAVNRDEIIQILLGNMASPAKTLLTPASPYYDKELEAVPYDPERARKLLDKGGFPKKGDHRFELTFKTTTDITRISVAKAIASQLRKIGIKVVVESMEWGRFKMDIDRGRVQLWSLTWIGFKDPEIYKYAFATESFPPNGGNRGWYSNPTLDKLLEDGRSTTQFAERAKIYKEVQKIVAKDLPYVFLWHEDNFALINKDIEGFTLYADGRYSSLTQTYFR